MSAVCMKCRQSYSEKHHKCLEVMTLEEVYQVSEESVQEVLAAVLKTQEREWDDKVLEQYERLHRRGRAIPPSLEAAAKTARERLKDRVADEDSNPVG